MLSSGLFRAISRRVSGSGQIAPEGDFEHLQPDQPLRDQLVIDAYDFLQLERLGVDVPEADYQLLATLQGALDYLDAAVGFVRS